MTVCRPMLMSTDVASLMLPVNRGIMDRERDIDTAAAAAGAHATAGPAVVRGMKRGDPEPDAQTAAALADLAGAECKRPRIDGTGNVVGDIGQVMETQLILHSLLIRFSSQCFVGTITESSLSLLTVKHLFLSITSNVLTGSHFLAVTKASLH